MDEKSNKRTTDLATNLEASTLGLGVSSISHQSAMSSSSSSLSVDRNDELESQLSMDSSFNSSIFDSVPTKDEAAYSMQAFQSYMNDEGPRMLVENPAFQAFDAAFQFLKTLKVQEMVGSVMCDAGVIGAILRNDAVQDFLRSEMLGSSAKRLTSGETVITSPNISQSSDNLVSVILSWLMDNIEAGIGGLFGIFRSLVNKTIESSQNEIPCSGSGTGGGLFGIFRSLVSESPQNANPCYGAIYMILFLSIILLMIVLVQRALKQKFKI